MSFTQASAFLADKGKHRHFMAKEIAEQPEVIGHTLAEYVDFADGRRRLPREICLRLRQSRPADHHRLRHGLLAGLPPNTGSSAMPGCRPRSISLPNSAIARRRCRKGGLPSSSRSRARPPIRWRRCAIARSKARHRRVVNVPGSTIAREADAVFRTYAGPEIGVASTKAFTCQLAVLAALGDRRRKARGAISRDEERELIGALIEARGIWPRS